ncbi:MAG: hypothetical protein K5872_22055 [Rhizobiaceae bacterium]|nr:hypothetical protein [Rhizobiaceae bacterium]MCV0408904.1 hypothetical protein [Rhizobiaceae bacterium]
MLAEWEAFGAVGYVLIGCLATSEIWRTDKVLALATAFGFSGAAIDSLLDALRLFEAAS